MAKSAPLRQKAHARTSAPKKPAVPHNPIGDLIAYRALMKRYRDESEISNNLVVGSAPYRTAEKALAPLLHELRVLEGRIQTAPVSEANLFARIEIIASYLGGPVDGEQLAELIAGKDPAERAAASVVIAARALMRDAGYLDDAMRDHHQKWRELCRRFDELEARLPAAEKASEDAYDGLVADLHAHCRSMNVTACWLIEHASASTAGRAIVAEIAVFYAAKGEEGGGDINYSLDLEDLHQAESDLVPPPGVTPALGVGIYPLAAATLVRLQCTVASRMGGDNGPG